MDGEGVVEVGSEWKIVEEMTSNHKWLIFKEIHLYLRIGRCNALTSWNTKNKKNEKKENRLKKESTGDDEGGKKSKINKKNYKTETHSHTHMNIFYLVD